MTTEAVRGQLGLAGGRAVGYREWGRPDGPVLLALHTVGESSDSFRLLAPLLGERFRVIAPDARGHGDSDWAQDYGFGVQAADVVAVMEALGVLAAAVLGHGTGAVTAFQLALSDPDRARALVLAQPPAPVAADPPLPLRGGPLPGDTYDWRAEVAATTWCNDPPTDWWQRAETIGCRALVVHGSSSKTSPHPRERLARLIPRGQFTQLEVGAAMHEERPGEFAALVMAFLADAIH